VNGMSKPKRIEDLERIGINPILWLMHFENKRPDKATCMDCVDYKAGTCKGRKDPIECFKEKSKNVIFMWGRGEEED
jgi:hypothetical protein